MLRPALLALLLALALPPGQGAGDPCDRFEVTDYVALAHRVHYASHRCHWHDITLQATITEEIERYDGYETRLVGAGAGTERLLFTLMTRETETRFHDGRLAYQHRTVLYAGGADARHDYNEQRDARGDQTCSGAALVRPGVVPGQVIVPTTPKYPKCAPPGLLV